MRSGDVDLDYHTATFAGLASYTWSKLTTVRDDRTLYTSFDELKVNTNHISARSYAFPVR